MSVDKSNKSEDGELGWIWFGSIWEKPVCMNTIRNHPNFSGRVIVPLHGFASGVERALCPIINAIALLVVPLIALIKRDAAFLKSGLGKIAANLISYAVVGTVIIGLCYVGYLFYLRVGGLGSFLPVVYVSAGLTSGFFGALGYSEGVKKQKRLIDDVKNEQFKARRKSEADVAFFKEAGRFKDLSDCQDAAEKENADAQYLLGRYFSRENAIAGIEPSWDVAAIWFRKAADNEQVDAEYWLALCYMGGHGVEQSWDEAAIWCRNAAERGHPNAEYMLGFCYCFGLGVEESWGEVVTWFRKAAERGHPNAQYILGRCYAKGQGVEPSQENAIRWFQAAADNGHQSARKALAKIKGSDAEAEKEEDQEKFDGASVVEVAAASAQPRKPPYIGDID